jgi:hypothetical protein
MGARPRRLEVGRTLLAAMVNAFRWVSSGSDNSLRACSADSTFVFSSSRPESRYTWQRMAWNFRRSLKFGPIKLNLSKSGVGYSVGGRGFRVGKDARGRSYTATSIPGTGLYSRTYSSQAKAAAGSAAPMPAPQPSRNGGAALGLLYLLLAFGLGALAVFILTPHPVPPPAIPPAAVSAPVAPPAIPVKRTRVHRSKRPGHESHTTPHPASDAPPSAN